MLLLERNYMISNEVQDFLIKNVLFRKSKNFDKKTFFLSLTETKKLTPTEYLCEYERKKPIFILQEEQNGFYATLVLENYIKNYLQFTLVLENKFKPHIMSKMFLEKTNIFCKLRVHNIL